MLCERKKLTHSTLHKKKYALLYNLKNSSYYYFINLIFLNILRYLKINYLIKIK